MGRALLPCNSAIPVPCNFKAAPQADGEFVSSSASDRLFPTTRMWAADKSETDAPATSARSEDEALIARVQAGDEIALGTRLDRYAPLGVGAGSPGLLRPGGAPR